MKNKFLKYMYVLVIITSMLPTSNVSKNTIKNIKNIIPGITKIQKDNNNIYSFKLIEKIKNIF